MLQRRAWVLAQLPTKAKGVRSISDDVPDRLRRFREAPKSFSYEGIDIVNPVPKTTKEGKGFRNALAGPRPTGPPRQSQSQSPSPVETRQSVDTDTPPTLSESLDGPPTPKARVSRQAMSEALGGQEFLRPDSRRVYSPRPTEGFTPREPRAAGESATAARRTRLGDRNPRNTPRGAKSKSSPRRDTKSPLLKPIAKPVSEIGKQLRVPIPRSSIPSEMARMQVLEELKPAQESVALAMGTLELPPPPPTPTCDIPMYASARALENLLQPESLQFPPWILYTTPRYETPLATRSFTSNPLPSVQAQARQFQKKRVAGGLTPQAPRFKTSRNLKVRLPIEGSSPAESADITAADKNNDSTTTAVATAQVEELAQDDIEAWSAIPFERKTIFNYGPTPIERADLDARARFRLESIGGDYSAFMNSNAKEFDPARQALAQGNGLGLMQRRKALRVIRGLVIGAGSKRKATAGAVIDMVKSVEGTSARV